MSLGFLNSGAAQPLRKWVLIRKLAKMLATWVPLMW